MSALPIICIVGPTASGKSALALELARELDGEIVNADSRQFYRELVIGTAKPTTADLASAPHHLIDCASIREPWDVGKFAATARAVIKDIQARNRAPIVCGGTGMYVRGLIRGVAAIPEVPSSLREKLRARLGEEGLTKLYTELLRLDPQAAVRLKPGDTQRVLRALEVVIHTGKPLDEYWERETTALNATQIGLEWPRDTLYERINARVDAMFDAGLKREAQKLYAAFPGDPVLAKTIGYAEWLKTGFDDDEAVREKVKLDTRRFAKRQLTWFRGDKMIAWFKADVADLARRVFGHITKPSAWDNFHGIFTKAEGDRLLNCIRRTKRQSSRFR